MRTFRRGLYFARAALRQHPGASFRLLAPTLVIAALVAWRLFGLHWAVSIAIGAAAAATNIIVWGVSAEQPVADPLPTKVAVSTARLHIRRLTADDAPALEASMDDEFLDANGWTRGHRRTSVRGLRLGLNMSLAGALVGAEADGRAVVFFSVHRPPTSPAALLIGVWTAPSKRGLGLAREGLEAVVELLQAEGHDRLVFETNKNNSPMRRTIEHTGAVLTGESSTVLPNGNEVDSVAYEIGPVRE